MWIRLSDLPFHLWLEDILRGIRDYVGTLLAIDRSTQGKGKLAFARLYVMVDVNVNLIDSIDLTYDLGTLTQIIEYENGPLACIVYLSNDHLSSKCPLKKSVNSDKKKANLPEAKALFTFPKKGCKRNDKGGPPRPVEPRKKPRSSPPSTNLAMVIFSGTLAFLKTCNPFNYPSPKGNPRESGFLISEAEVREEFPKSFLSILPFQSSEVSEVEGPLKYLLEEGEFTDKESIVSPSQADLAPRGNLPNNRLDMVPSTHEDSIPPLALGLFPC